MVGEISNIPTQDNKPNDDDKLEFSKDLETTPLSAATTLAGLKRLIKWKNPVRVATIANGTLATAYENGDTIDGITLATGDRILLKNQTTGSENGIYTVNATGAPTRAVDFDDNDEVVGSIILALEGTANNGKAWRMTNTGTVTIGTTALTFTEFGSTTGGGPTLSRQSDELASTFTTTSPTFEDSGLSITLANRSGGLFYAGWSGTIFNSTNSASVYFRFVEGSTNHSAGRYFATSTTSHPISQSALQISGNLDGDVLKIQVRATAGSGDFRQGSDQSNKIEVLEIS